MNTKKHFLLLISFLFYGITSYAQGCSDAGFCTLDGLKNKQENNYKNEFKAGISSGFADNDIYTFGTYIQYSRNISDKITLRSKITSLGQSGNNISVHKLSDIYLSANYRINPKLKGIISTKIPLNSANAKHQNLALPMDYQSSLGTFDFIAGLSYEFHNFILFGAIQQPLTQNKNSYIASDSFPILDPNKENNGFSSTANFKRKGDILFRISYPLNLSDKLRLSPSLLPIFHLGKDKYTDLSGVEKEIIGSDGLTLNANLFLDYKLSNRSNLQLSLASPFIVRKIRPDGLTRSFIGSLEYSIRF